MKILFMGTPDFAVNSLERMNKEHDVVGVFTKIDKINQRGRKVKFGPVKQYALDNNIPVYQPNSVKSEETLNIIRELNPDLIVVVAYGKILPKELIEMPRLGVINVHSSILPKYRGAAPIHAAIINGETETGVTIMHIAEELDAGDIILIGKTEITDEDTLATLHDRLAIIGAEELSKAVYLLDEGKAPRIAQDHLKATFVKPIKKEETLIDWSNDSRSIFNFVRGMNPFPSSHSFLDGDVLYKIYAVEVFDREYEGSFGEVVDLIKGIGPVVKVKDKSLIITKAKPQNKKMLSGNDLLNGNYVKVGQKFRGGKNER